MAVRADAAVTATAVTATAVTAVTAGTAVTAVTAVTATRGLAPAVAVALKQDAAENTRGNLREKNERCGGAGKRACAVMVCHVCHVWQVMVGNVPARWWAAGAVDDGNACGAWWSNACGAWWSGAVHRGA